MDITESNKIIAEFMGYIDNGCSEEGFLINPKTNYDEDISELKYYTSWDWLMPVVEKIEGLTLSAPYLDGFGVVFYHSSSQYKGVVKYRSCFWIANKETPGYNSSPQLMDEQISESRIDSIYNSVIQFIQWHNKTKS